MNSRDGDDGAWSTFPLLVGNPSTLIRVLPSTAGSTTLAVGPVGCVPSNVTASNCNTTRAGIYEYSNSTSATFIGKYGLGLEANLGYPLSTGTYVLDTVSLGFSNATTQASLESQMVASYGSNSFYIGLFGLSRQPGNFSNLEDSHPSYLTSLKNQNLIPSLSWSYTAGARYRSESEFGSLTLGGFDSSKFVANNVSFPLAGDISRDTVVPIQSISSKNSTGYSASLLPTPISAYIDSTIPCIYLPEAACQLFEQTLGLFYDSTLEKYIVDDGLHQSLLANNTNITFHLGNSGDTTIDIEMPYASFDLQGKFPFLPNGTNSTRYFPLRKATNDTQYTLGRTFLQEAYLITNYEYSNFSVSKRIFNDNAPKIIVPALSANETATLAAEAHHPVDWRLAIGVGVPVGVIFLLLVCLLLVFLIRRRRHTVRSVDRVNGQLNTVSSQVELPADLPLPEAVPNETFGYHEAFDTGKVELASEKYATLEFHEMGDTARHEMPVTRTRDHSVIEVTSTIEVERTDDITKRPPAEGPAHSDGRSSGTYVVSPVTPVDRKRRNQSSSTCRPPKIVTSSDKSVPSERSPVSSPTSGNPSLNKSLPPTPISESVRTSYSPSVSEVSPGAQFALRSNLPTEHAESDTDEIETFTPLSDVSEGPRIATFNALSPWRHSPSTPVSPQTARSTGSSQSSSYTTRSPATYVSEGVQMETTIPPHRHQEGEGDKVTEKEEQSDNFNWNVHRAAGQSRWPQGKS